MHIQFSSFQDIVSFLDTRGLFHMDMSLHRMEDALSRLELTDPPYRVVQVVGTNGKGSTSCMLAHICTEHHLVTGLYTSPHFVSPAERIQIPGLPFEEDLWVDAANRVYEAAPGLTYFEFMTVLALEIYRRREVDVAVLEAGLGGAHDATTAVQPNLLCYTPIALDHRDVLGATVQEIAHDKASAIRCHVPVISAQQYPVVEDILVSTAEQQASEYRHAEPLDPCLGQCIGMKGEHQYRNASLAVAAWNILAGILSVQNSEDCVCRGLQKACLPGRLQSVVSGDQYPDMILDGGHNPHGVQTVLTSLKQMNICPSALVYACLDDKDWRTVLRLLKQEYHGRIPAYFPQLTNSRAADAQTVSAYWYGEPGHVWKDPVTCLADIRHCQKLQNSQILVIGSLYLLSEIYTRYPELLMSVC